MANLKTRAKLKRARKKSTLRQRLLGRTLTGKIARGVGVAGAVGVGAGALKARSYLGGLKSTAREKGDAAYKTYATNTGSTTDAAKYAEKAQKGAYVGRVRRDLGRYIGTDRASRLGEKLYGRARNRQGFAYSRRDELSTFTMGLASQNFYGNRAEFASRKDKEKEPQKRGNAITKGLKYGTGAGLALGGVGGYQLMRQAASDPKYHNLSPGQKRVGIGIGTGMGAVQGAGAIGALGGLAGLGVYGVNRLRKRRDEKKRNRGVRGRVRQLRSRIGR